MTEILTIDVIKNNRGGHDDLLFSIPDLIGYKRFDTYYFGIAIEPLKAIDDVRKAVSQLIQFWRDKVLISKNGETIFLPIDFSDETTGCLQVQNKNEQLVLTYGFSRREGYSVDPLNPEDYYKDISDFQSDTEKQMTFDKLVFISVLELQINKLKSLAT